VQLVARAFSNDNIVKKTGYVFCALEPLEHLGSGVLGGKTFDLAIVNKNEGRSIFVEAKTTDSFDEGKAVLGEMKKKIEFAENNFAVFLDETGMSGQLDWAKAEFVVCIEKGRGSEGCSAALSNCLKQAKETNVALPIEIARRTLVWQYLWADPSSKSIILDKVNSHQSKALNDLLEKGIIQGSLPDNVPIPFLLTDHPWIILLHLVSYLISKNFSNPAVQDKKKLQIDDMVEYAVGVLSTCNSSISAGARNRVVEVVTSVVNHGVEYDMLERDGNTVMVRCRSEKERSILEEFKDKYLGVDFEMHAGTYAKKRADLKAKRQAVEEYEAKFPSTLEGFVEF